MDHMKLSKGLFIFLCLFEALLLSSGVVSLVFAGIHFAQLF